MRFLAQIQGGVGPDVWDTEIFISAADFLDAAKQAATRAAETRGRVTQLEQFDEQPKFSEPKMTAHIHAHAMATFAKDAAETDRPWERWEFHLSWSSDWRQCECTPSWNPTFSYRRKSLPSDEQPSAHERLIDRLANELLTAHVHKAQLKAALSGYVHGDTEGGWNAFVAEQILATPNEDATIHELRRAERERVISEVRKLSASGGGCPLSDSNIQGYNDAITQVIETIRKLGDE